ncbi:unnamed protein product, partial [Phaeothamnion confervicola]
GSTSNVWKAVDVETLQLVAVKEVVAGSREARVSLARELAALTPQLSPLTPDSRASPPAAAAAGGCPHIVTFYGSFVKAEGGPELCIAVEYERGGNLQSWLEDRRPAPEPWLAHISRQALNALRYLHGQGRIHRDVKPANMLLTKFGDMKLADFGIAVRALQDGKRSAMAGTRRYMSPERLRAEVRTGE